ncbi:hypothetical protein [Grimontia hollisae]|uniref:Uncharacterized protein n=1 Tax=Grimontia hollisae TaxID=673 RepID=A0A377HJ01_GRIHO|nr:hypothetical protein [Grimontia hollisae]STO56169.1 Uncharacterised protein [Grimontia hollisae]STQ77018.1 Uncharacterised protein [Grimontia hollisae]
MRLYNAPQIHHPANVSNQTHISHNGKQEDLALEIKALKQERERNNQKIEEFCIDVSMMMSAAQKAGNVYSVSIPCLLPTPATQQFVVDFSFGQ